MNKIVILGNGFDLAHGLKTKYDDFIKHIINLSINCDKDVRKELIDVSGLDSEYQSYNYIRENFIEIRKFANRYGEINFSNLFFKELISNYFISDWVDIEAFYFHHLSLAKPERIDVLQHEFELIKKHLQLYLIFISESSPLELIPEFLEIFKLENPDSILFLNFNYTTRIHQYFNALTDIKKKSILNIHGDLYDKSNPIIFGYGDNKDTRYIEIIHKRNNKYLRNLKRQQYNLADQYSQIKNQLDNGEKFEIFSIGHSLGLSDKTLLKEIFENQNLQKIRMYYYNDIEGYRDLNDNIRRIVNDETFSKVINYTKSFKIPQK
ncbi:MAG TPA: AbiH family protein [Lutibacter sp.]